jgi:ABC-type lipoprotein export system ATPase subunit
MQAMGIVSIRSATKSDHLGNVEVQALRGVSREVQAGEFMSIAGPSGKTGDAMNSNGPRRSV